MILISMCCALATEQAKQPNDKLKSSRRKKTKPNDHCNESFHLKLFCLLEIVFNRIPNFYLHCGFFFCFFLVSLSLLFPSSVYSTVCHFNLTLIYLPHSTQRKNRPFLLFFSRYVSKRAQSSPS